MFRYGNIILILRDSEKFPTDKVQPEVRVAIMPNSARERQRPSDDELATVSLLSGSH